MMLLIFASSEEIMFSARAKWNQPRYRATDAPHRGHPDQQCDDTHELQRSMDTPVALETWHGIGQREMAAIREVEDVSFTAVSGR